MQQPCRAPRDPKKQAVIAILPAFLDGNRKMWRCCFEKARHEADRDFQAVTKRT
jgi:hypothetical protein